MRKFGTAIGASAIGAAIWLATSAAWADAQTPAITGDKWAAYGIIGGLVAAVVLFVLASVGISRRDEAYERGHRHHNEIPGLPMLGDEEDGKDDD